MHLMTKENLKSAFSGESQAYMKYIVFADKAEEEGFKEIARLFRAIAFAERVHASNHLNALNGLNLTVDNLDVAIAGETYEVNEMYPSYKAVAELQDEQRAIKSMHYALEAEKIHAALYNEARDAVKTGKDLEMGEVNICPVCGHTVVGKAPDRCPICGVQGDRFKRF
ncbi:MAG: rubrerythrin family protein [Nitrospirae bacterium]|nr:rubrerythrin family protein [Nitrospirota bacterium]MCL5423210.1 rubrerythrin family protein [Nitrospirota bacterium]